jgi:hypothetical protein
MGFDSVTDRVTIAISRETAERPRKLGRYGDTMESIIHRVLDTYEKMEEQPGMIGSAIVAFSLPFIIKAMSSTALVTWALL